MEGDLVTDAGAVVIRLNSDTLLLTTPCLGTFGHGRSLPNLTTISSQIPSHFLTSFHLATPDLASSRHPFLAPCHRAPSWSPSSPPSRTSGKASTPWSGSTNAATCSSPTSPSACASCSCCMSRGTCRCAWGAWGAWGERWGQLLDAPCMRVVNMCVVRWLWTHTPHNWLSPCAPTSCMGQKVSKCRILHGRSVDMAWHGLQGTHQATYTNPRLSILPLLFPTAPHSLLQCAPLITLPCSPFPCACVPSL